MGRNAPTASTLKWCRKEAGPMVLGLQLLFRSQLGYEGRQLEKKCSKRCLQAAVMGGDVVDPLNPSPPTTKTLYNFRLPFQLPAPPEDVLERANVVAAGIRTFTRLLSQGTYPGSGGYTVSPTGQKMFKSGGSFLPTQEIISSLTKVADLLTKGTLKLPNIPLPNLQELGGLVLPQSTKRPMFGEDAFAKKKSVAVEMARAANSPPTQEMATLNTGLTPEEEEFLLKAAQSVDDLEAEEKIRGKQKKSDPVVYRPVLPKDFSIKLENNSNQLAASKESTVPSSRIGRLATFGQLAFGLAGGAAAEVTRRTFGYGAQVVSDNPFLSDANADRIVQTLCRVRGAALKLGQMLSIQDSDTVPPALLQIFERVRHSADFMPISQVHKQMINSFGAEWRDNFAEFEDKPFAAASIGQVHKATLKDGRKVAVKVQYPGVAKGIDSDIDNIVSLLNIGGIFPKGMFLEQFVVVARRELRQECDYKREARAMREFRRLLAGSNDFFVPDVIDSLSSDCVLTTEYVVGKPVDQCLDEPQVVRDYIAGKFVELCLKEIFEWRFMQTDPNWSNFFLGIHPTTGEPRLVLLDFGASRAYPKKFVDKYMQIIKAAYDLDTKAIIQYSREIGFLTGYETEVMEKAHVESVLIMGETLANDHPYDFSNQDVTKRIHKLVPVMLEHRLTAPPEEIYSLHRKLSGSYLVATKLKATVSCGGLFNEINKNYKPGEDGKDIDIDNVGEKPS